MRRLVDAAIPAFCIVALAPAAVQIMELPASLERSLGEFIGRIWAVALTVAMVAICVGIAFRAHRPEWSFRCEWPALIFSGFISMIYGASIFLINGMPGWTAAWFVWAIGAHFLFRFVEMSLARHNAGEEQDMTPGAVLLGVLAILGSLGGLAALVRALIDRPKVRADAVAAITNAASSQIQSLSTRLAVVETRLDVTQSKLDETDKKANTAEQKVSQLSWQQKNAAGWHRRHMPFDNVMQRIAQQIKPEMLDDPALLKDIPALEPFPYWDDHAV